MPSPIILLEFNELSPTLMDRFIGEERLPAFKRLRDESVVFTTDAEMEPPHLEPWIQWVTVHTGAPFSEHQVFDLNDGPKCDLPRLWDRAADAGMATWVCGSMNASSRSTGPHNLFLPDPWATDIEPGPPGLFDAYFRFVSRHVQEHASREAPVSRAETLAFVRFMVANGLSAKTVVQTLRQLLEERRSDSHWRRAAILDRLQWDVFRSFYRRTKPELATFFLNSTAHYQHYFWRDMEPELFALPSEDQGRDGVADAIAFGYERMDRLVAECLQMAPDATIVLCTALSQQPLTRYEGEGGKQVFKVKDVAALMEAAGVAPGWSYAPVMAEEFKLHFPSASDAHAAETALADLATTDGAALMQVRRSGDTLFLGCALTRTPAETARFGRRGDPAAHGFADHFFALEGLKSGGHHPDGILWWRLPSKVHATVARKVSLEEIAPTALTLLGLPADGLRPPLPEVVAATAGSTPAPALAA